MVASDESMHNSMQKVFKIFESLEDLVEGLATFDVNDADDIRVVHGVMSSAEFLPNDFKSKTAFVVAVDAIDEKNSILVEAGDTPEHVEDSVSDLIRSGIGDINRLEIDDLFVIYGYELPLILSVNAEDVDDEVIDVCHQIEEEVNEVMAENQRLTSEQEE